MRCARSSMQPSISLASIRQPFIRKLSYQVPSDSSNFHTLSRRPALPGHDVPAPPRPRNQQQPPQQTHTYLGRTYNGLQIRFFSQSRRQWRYSYQRFDRSGAGVSPGFPETKLQRVWRVYRKHIIGGGTVVVGFYVYNLEEVPVCPRFILCDGWTGLLQGQGRPVDVKSGDRLLDHFRTYG